MLAYASRFGNVVMIVLENCDLHPDCWLYYVVVVENRTDTE